MAGIGLLVEGETDRVAMVTLLASRGLTVDHHRVRVTNGKVAFDANVSKYNQAARRAPWLAVRDLDADADECAVQLRRQLLLQPEQADAFCLRVARRALEAWLLADAAAMATFFSVAPALVPADPESVEQPKRALVDLCRRSRSSAVRRGMVPPRRSPRLTGPEYTAFISEFARDHWRPDVAAGSSPSLARALADIDRLVEARIWQASRRLVQFWRSSTHDHSDTAR